MRAPGAYFGKGAGGGLSGLSAVGTGSSQMRLSSLTKSMVLAVDGRSLAALSPLRTVWSSRCASAGALAPVNTSRRSMSRQTEHENVRCSNPGKTVGSARTASIRTISALHTKHRIALNQSFTNETYGALGAEGVQACRCGCSQRLAVSGDR